MKEGKSFALPSLGFGFSDNKNTLLLLTAALVVLFLCNAHWNGELFTKDDSHWKYWLDPLISIVTLFIAGFVWWREADEGWRESQPKRLAVLFNYKKQEIMSCDHEHLAGVTDIRAQGQQIGLQMSDVHWLEFNVPRVIMECLGPQQLKEKKKEEEKENEKEYCMVYSTHFELFKIPEALQQTTPPSLLVHWKQPFEVDEVSSS